MARRNLTLLAKIMQNLANNVDFGGVKEGYMAPLNPVLERNRERLHDFLDDLTNVNDLNVHIGIDKYLALGRTSTPVINISLNEMYFIHALLKEHIQSLVSEKDRDRNTLVKILNEIGPAPPQLPRKDNANVDLELDTSVPINEDSNEDCNFDEIYSEVKYLLFTIMKSSDKFKPSENFTITELVQQASGLNVPVSGSNVREMAQKLRCNLEILIKQGILSEEDDFAPLRQDIANELLNQDNLLKKLQTDREKLVDVLENIKNHHTFLCEQFSAYEQYLGNVRQKSTSVTTRNKDANKKSNNKSKKKKEKSRGPFKYSHLQLQKEGIIIVSEVPEDRRSSIFFVFSSSTPGLFDVTVMFGRRQIAKIQLALDDLLERQHNNMLEFETEFLKLNVNLLLFLLNRDFML